MSYLLGYDIGSSSVKASLLEAETGVIVAAAASPRTEMEISSPHPGWAEQHPDTWWEHVRRATAIIKAQAGAKLPEVKAIGISYQMHGLVIVDRDLRVDGALKRLTVVDVNVRRNRHFARDELSPQIRETPVADAGTTVRAHVRLLLDEAPEL